MEELAGPLVEARSVLVVAVEAACLAEVALVAEVACRVVVAFAEASGVPWVDPVARQDPGQAD